MSGSKLGGSGRNNGRVGGVGLPSIVCGLTAIRPGIPGPNNGGSRAYHLGVCEVVGVPLGPATEGSRNMISLHSFNRVVRVTVQK